MGLSCQLKAVWGGLLHQVSQLNEIWPLMGLLYDNIQVSLLTKQWNKMKPYFGEYSLPIHKIDKISAQCTWQCGKKGVCHAPVGYLGYASCISIMCVVISNIFIYSLS